MKTQFRSNHEGGEAPEGLAQLKQITEVASQNAGTMYLAMASAALAIRQPAEANHYAEKAAKSPLKPEQQKFLQQLAGSIENRIAPPENCVSSPAETRRPSDLDEDPGRPILKRKRPSPTK